MKTHCGNCGNNTTPYKLTATPNGLTATFCTLNCIQQWIGEDTDNPYETE